MYIGERESDIPDLIPGFGIHLSFIPMLYKGGLPIKRPQFLRLKAVSGLLRALGGLLRAISGLTHR